MIARYVFSLLWTVIVVTASGPVMAQGKAALARETAEYLLRFFGKESAEMGAKGLARQLETLALKHGDDVFKAARKVGPRALRYIEESGVHGPLAARLLAQHGDEALWVVRNPSRLALCAQYGDEAAIAMCKHGEIAEPLIDSFGAPASKALQSVNGQNARRLAIMAKNGELARIGRTTELCDVISKYGDPAMDFIWRNKGSLMVAAVLTTFLMNPEPYIKGAVSLPLNAVPRVDWTKVVLRVITLALGCVAFYWIFTRFARWLWKRLGQWKKQPKTQTGGIQTFRTSVDAARPVEETAETQTGVIQTFRTF